MNIDLYTASDLNFVEFNITGDNQNYIRCDNESKFVDTNVFNLFIDCFESSHKLYEYFEPTKYNSRSIVILKNRLEDNLDMLKSIETIDSFNTFVNKKAYGFEFKSLLEECYGDWESEWDYYCENLLRLNQSLVDLVEKCINDVRILWVIGY